MFINQKFNSDQHPLNLAAGSIFIFNLEFQLN